MHGFTPEQHRKHLRDFAWMFSALFATALVIAGLIVWSGQTRAGLLMAGISLVPLLCVGMQWIELAQLEKRP